ncbi:ABC transporter substrate-binding protein [Thermocrispum sp.]|uniref:ABC transporter substrate-binding protein n=1 Tax=Thermocrispum TaxID=37924 RepID=UPI0006885EA2|nr:ABC transporter substrate-binding protein [Thermocrispum sp.]
MAGSLLTAAGVVAGCSSEADNVVTLYYALEQYVPHIVATCNEEANGEYQIVHRQLPRDADGQREQMVRRLAAGDTDLDLLGLDVTWVPEFAEAKWLAEWTGEDKASVEEDTLEVPLKTATWDGKLYAAPMNTNVQLLWYDKSLTPEPPKTWEEMIEMSRDLKAQGKPYQILYTGAQYEGLVVAFNSLVNSAGGQVLSDDGTEVTLDDKARRALEIMRQMVDEGLNSPSLSNAQEQQVVDSFSPGDSQAAFQINWPFVYAATRDAKSPRFENLAWTTYPGVGDNPGRVTVGGFNIAVSAYSEKKDLAFKAARCLRQAKNQKYAAICGGVPPTLESLYKDEEPIAPCDGDTSGKRQSMVDAYPMRDDILKSLKTAAVRPLTPVYQNLSTVTSKILSPPGSIDPQATLEELREELNNAVQSQGVLP